MTERVRAESQLAQLIDEQERRVRERTADLEAEVAVRREAEENAQSQLQRLNLLHQITRATSDRKDLHSIYDVVVRSLEEQLPVDLCCLCLYDAGSNVLTVSKVGPRCTALARQLGLTERARLAVDSDALAHCVRGTPVSEPDTSLVTSPLSQRLAQAGLRSLVVSPLKIEERVFAVLIVARRMAQGFSNGKVKFLRQLSEHVGLAAHQAQLYEALKQAYDDLQQTQHAVMQQERLRALGQMASGIGHDINNALSPIALHTESLLESEPNLSPRTRESLQTIQRAMEGIAADRRTHAGILPPARGGIGASAGPAQHRGAAGHRPHPCALGRHAARARPRHHRAHRPGRRSAGHPRRRKRDPRGPGQPGAERGRRDAERRHPDAAHQVAAGAAPGRERGLYRGLGRRHRRRHE